MAQLKELIVNGASRLLNTLNVDGSATFGETISTKKITIGANGPTGGDNGVAIQSSEHLLLYSNDNPKKGLWIGAGANLYLSYGRNNGDTSNDQLIIQHDTTEIAIFDKDNNFIVKNNLIVDGQASLIAPKIYNSSTINPRYRYLYFYNQSNTSLGHIRYDSGHATNITTGQFSFREYSPNDPAGTTTTGKRESYNLPAVDIGLSADKDYDILTTKNLITIAQGGTGASTVTGALQHLIGSTSIGDASTPIYWNGNNFTLARNTLGIYYEALNVQDLNIGTDEIIPAPGAYYINSKIQASDAAVEYGTILTLGGTSATNRYYTGQLLISSAAGVTTPHLRIRRILGSKLEDRRWSDWSILLDNNNYMDYTVKKDGTGATGNWNITAVNATNAVNISQTKSEADGWRKILLQATYDDSYNITKNTIDAGKAYFSNLIAVNPKYGHLYIKGNLIADSNSLLNGNTNIQGNLSVTGNVTLNNSTLIEDLTANSLIVNGQAIFNNGLIGNLTGTATKVSNKLKIGNETYDGSTEVNIPIYNGETS